MRRDSPRVAQARGGMACGEYGYGKPPPQVTWENLEKMPYLKELQEEILGGDQLMPEARNKRAERRRQKMRRKE